VHLTETGVRGPPVVLVAGAGDCAASWFPVIGRIAAFGRAISYDRAGLGGSGDGRPARMARSSWPGTPSAG